MELVVFLVGFLAFCSGGNASPVDDGRRLLSVKADTLNVHDGLKATVDEILRNNRRIEVVGNYGNKLYFSQATNMNANVAKSFCETNKMQLITIDTEGELTYLRNLPENRYWTSAVDWSLYKWETGAVVLFPVSPFHLTCVLFYKPWGSLIADPCDGSIGATYYPLCQLVNAKD